MLSLKNRDIFFSREIIQIIKFIIDIPIVFSAFQE